MVFDQLVHPLVQLTGTYEDSVLFHHRLAVYVGAVEVQTTDHYFVFEAFLVIVNVVEFCRINMSESLPLKLHVYTKVVTYCCHRAPLKP